MKTLALALGVILAAATVAPASAQRTIQEIIQPDLDKLYHQADAPPAPPQSRPYDGPTSTTDCHKGYDAELAAAQARGFVELIRALQELTPIPVYVYNDTTHSKPVCFVYLASDVTDYQENTRLYDALFVIRFQRDTPLATNSASPDVRTWDAAHFNADESAFHYGFASFAVHVRLVSERDTPRLEARTEQLSAVERRFANAQNQREIATQRQRDTTTAQQVCGSYSKALIARRGLSTDPLSVMPPVLARPLAAGMPVCPLRVLEDANQYTLISTAAGIVPRSGEGGAFSATPQGVVVKVEGVSASYRITTAEYALLKARSQITNDGNSLEILAEG